MESIGGLIQFVIFMAIILGIAENKAEETVSKIYQKLIYNISIRRTKGDKQMANIIENYLLRFVGILAALGSIYLCISIFILHLSLVTCLINMFTPIVAVAIILLLLYAVIGLVLLIKDKIKK